MPRLLAAMAVLAFPAIVACPAVAAMPGAASGACTMEAKQCPDGSWVGRAGPACEFAPCPSAAAAPRAGRRTASAGTLAGRVALSPRCPVARMPPDPACAPAGYQTSVQIYDANGRTVGQAQANARGEFRFSLPAGTYRIAALGRMPYPRCAPQTVTVREGATTSIEIPCDSGVR